MENTKTIKEIRLIRFNYDEVVISKNHPKDYCRADRPGLDRNFDYFDSLSVEEITEELNKINLTLQGDKKYRCFALENAIYGSTSDGVIKEYNHLVEYGDCQQYNV